MIAKRQQQSSTQPGHIPRQHSEDLNANNPWAPDNEQLRMELRAYLNNHTLEDQEEADYQLQCESGSILYRIIHYTFSSDPTLDGYFCGLSESTKSLPAQLSELRRGSLRRRKMIPLKETKEEEEEERGEEEEGDETPMTSINNPSVRWEDGGETEGEDEYGPQTLTQQESNDSDASSVEFSFDNFLSDDQLEAIEDVDSLLFHLERVELLYASSKRVVDKQYGQLSFKRRRAALVLWLKITEGLAKHLVNLSKWFGVIVNPVRRSEDDPLPCNVEPGTPSRQGSDGSGGNPPLPPPLLTSEVSVDPEESLSLSAISFASSFFQTQNSISSSRGTLQRLFSSRNILSIDEERVSSKGYSRFVDQVLKRKSLDWLIEKIIKSIKPILKTAKEAMKQLQVEEDKTDEDSDSEDNSSSERPSPLRLIHFGSVGTPGPAQMKRVNSVAPKCWMDEFQDMNLPSFAEQVS